MSQNKSSRESILKAIRLLLWVAAFALAWVIFEFIFIGSSRSIPMLKHIKVHISEFKPNNIHLVTKQSVPLLLVHNDSSNKDPIQNYSILMAIGTQHGCVVTKKSLGVLKESCGQAEYNYQGQLLSKNLDVSPLKVFKIDYNKQIQIFNLTLQ